MKKTDYILGLDLGQTTDFTALAVLERKTGCEPRATYSLRHLQRFPLGTAYPLIVERVLEIASTPPLQNSPMVVDQTGIGRAVVDMLQQSTRGTWIVPVTITAGQSVSRQPDCSFHVPKKELVTALQLLFQSRRLLIANSLPDADILIRELLNFRVKITLAANKTFGAWREGVHDDLVLAVALAAWFAERHPPASDDPIASDDSFIPEWEKFLH